MFKTSKTFHRLFRPRTTWEQQVEVWTNTDGKLGELRGYFYDDARFHSSKITVR